jgi:hypothetical protein
LLFCNAKVRRGFVGANLICRPPSMARRCRYFSPPCVSA